MSKLFLVVTLGLAVFAGGWGYSTEPATPTAAFVEFHKAVLAGDVEKSRDWLSRHTLDVLADITKGLEQSQEKFGKLSGDPVTARITNELMVDMHMSNNPAENDVWKSLLAEAMEAGNEPWLSSEILITGEEIKGVKAVLSVENRTSKWREVLVLEDGKWKVELPYVCQIALGGWQLDMANYMVKVEAVQAMARKSGVNKNKSDVSVREVVRK